MKKAFQLKPLLLSMAVASASSLAVVPATTQAGVTANVGMVTNYIFRGVEQTESASGSAGLDYEGDSGLYAGTWVADVEDGLEYDFYAGWGGEFDGISVGIGGSYYGYTEADFDDPYKEINLSLGYGMFTVGYDKGIYDTNPDEIDYDHKYIGFEYSGFSGTLGMLDGDLDTDDDALTYVDVGYSAELSKGLDGSINYVYSMPEDSNIDTDAYLIFGVTKTFDIM